MSAQVAAFPQTDFIRTLNKLSQPLPANQIKNRFGWTGKQGEAHYVDYVEWFTVADILDRECPEWSHTVKNIQQIGDFAVCTVALTIDGVTREGVGTGEAHSEMGIKGAESDALKRAAVKFGVARGLYKEDEVEGAHQERKAQAFTSSRGPASIKEPLAHDLDDLVTPRQLVAIQAISKALGIDADEECRTVFDKVNTVKELSRKAASSFIDYLKAKQIDKQLAK